jgi:photosystem II stability/assembly factor-like uncharacterized protein
MISVPTPRILLSTLPCVIAFALACSDGAPDPGSRSRSDWPTGELVSVDVIDEARAVVVAASGEIHRTHDAGATWQRAQNPVEGGLERVSLADGESGWASGEGVILRTEDGGASWLLQRIPGRVAKTRFVGLAAIDSQRALAIGDDGLLLRTADGGRLWKEISRAGEPEIGPGWGGVTCLPDGSGRCWSIGAAIRYTQDGGATWRRAEIESPVEFEPLRFEFGSIELGDDEHARLERFVDSLRARRDLQWRIDAGASAREIDRVVRQRDPMASLELIDARAQEVLSLIEEAGVAPQRISLQGSPPWDYEDHLDDDPEFLERYWTARTFPEPSVRVTVTEQPRLASLKMRDVTTGLAVGRDGVVLRTDDGGRHWRHADAFSTHDLLDLGFGRRRDVAVGAQGGLWVSGDDGRSWSRSEADPSAPFFESLRAVDFSEAGEFGLIVGSGGRVLRSLDGGASWEALRADRS